MKSLSIIFVVLFATFSMNAQQDLAGIWNTGEDNTKIEITEDAGVFKGKILSSDNAKAKIGTQIIKDVKLSNGEYKGKLYAAKRGEWYDVVLKENSSQLDITIKVGWMTKTVEWKKNN